MICNWYAVIAQVVHFLFTELLFFFTKTGKRECDKQICIFIWNTVTREIREKKRETESCYQYTELKICLRNREFWIVQIFFTLTETNH